MFSIKTYINKLPYFSLLQKNKMSQQYLHFKKAFYTLSLPKRVVPSLNTINFNYSNWFKMISAGFIIYSGYCYFKRTPLNKKQSPFHVQLLKNLFSWTLKKNNKNNKICNTNTNTNIELQVKEIPEHIKYDSGWYADLDEMKQSLSLESTSDNDVVTAIAANGANAALDTIREITPRGEIIMCYDAETKSFNYYSNNKNIPYSTLDAVARKYVCLHKVPSIYVDIRDEIQKGRDKNIKKEKKLKSEDNKTSSSSVVTKSLFAVFKNYKTGTGTNAVPKHLDSKYDKTIETADGGKEIILKESVNKFIYKGLVEEYDSDLKLKQLKSQQEYNANSNANSNNECVDGCDKGASKNLSYSDFKNKHKINQN